MTPLEIGLILAGIVLAFAGAAIFKYTVTLVGFLSGAMAGYLVAGYVALDPLLMAGATVVAGVLGVILAFSLITTVATLPGFMFGSYVAATVLGLSTSNLGIESIGLTLVGGVIGAAIAGLLFKKVLPILMAFVGAALATQAWTYEGFVTAADTLDPAPVLFEPTPLFIGVVVVGALSQYGLVKLGWATKITYPLGVLWAHLTSGGKPTDQEDEPLAASGETADADAGGDTGASPR